MCNTTLHVGTTSLMKNSSKLLTSGSSDIICFAVIRCFWLSAKSTNFVSGSIAQNETACYWSPWINVMSWIHVAMNTYDVVINICDVLNTWRQEYLWRCHEYVIRNASLNPHVNVHYWQLYGNDAKGNKFIKDRYFLHSLSHTIPLCVWVADRKISKEKDKQLLLN